MVAAAQWCEGGNLAGGLGDDPYAVVLDGLAVYRAAQIATRNDDRRHDDAERKKT